MFKVRLDRDAEDYKKGMPHVLSGFALEFVGELALGFGMPLPMGLSLILVGMLAVGVGLAYIAHSKNRSVAWGGLTVLSFVGWFLVACLREGQVSEGAESGSSLPGLIARP